MKLEYYIICGRGEGGRFFQLAKLQDSNGNHYKGQYDMSRHFASIEEMNSYIADEVLRQPLAELTITPMNI